jgi:hypothetical protein
MDINKERNFGVRHVCEFSTSAKTLAVPLLDIHFILRISQSNAYTFTFSNGFSDALLLNAGPRAKK